VTTSLDSFVIDCADHDLVGRFWASVLDWKVVEQDDEGTEIADPADRARPLLFVVVPEAKSVKNRIHIDLRPSASMAAEVERVLGLGATVQGRVDEGGSFWTVMQDPEGNEFCVLRGPEDGWSPE
jgi:predicted enzyme related to lactoylglutathione lyase